MANRKITFAQAINPSAQVTDLLYSYTDGNVVVNPTFANTTQLADITGDEWTTQAGWTINSNKLTGTSVAIGKYAIAPNKFGLKAGKTYNITYTVGGTVSGGIRMNIYGETTSNFDTGIIRTVAGTYTETMTIGTAGSGSFYESIVFSPQTSAFTGDIEDIFVSELSTVKDVKAIQVAGKILSIDRVNNTITYNEDANATGIGGNGDYVLFAKNKNINQNGVKGRYATITIESNATVSSKITDLTVGALTSSK